MNPTATDPWGPLFRSADPDTSTQAARDVIPRRGSQTMQLLAVYRNHALFGMTDEEAGIESGLAARPKCCYWKRCSDLRTAGFIEPTGDTRPSSAGSQMQVCRITAKGMEALK